MLQETAETVRSTQTTTESTKGSRQLRWIPWLLALFFVLWSLRAVNSGNIIDTDAARHAMNGALIHDMVRDSGFLKPIEYGKSYYGRLPALSMPYHPPLYPAIEALFYTIFGVSLTTARVLVALATGLSTVLFYRLILYTHHSHLLAAFSVSTFMLWKGSQFVAGDVMLEFPSMVFIVAAMLCLRNLDRGLDWKNASAFAVLAAAAVWTKQHAVFLGAVPFAYYLFRFRLSQIFQTSLWVASLLFGVCVVALTKLSAPFQNTGVDQVAPQYAIGEIAIFNARFYLNCFIDLLGTIPALLIGCTILSVVLWRFADRWAHKPGLALYWAWAVSAFAVLLLIGAYDIRYLFYVYAPLTVIAYASLFRVGSRIWARRDWIGPAVVAAICIIAGLWVPPHFLRGPAEAASVVMASKPQRILYCGSMDGNFIFSVRTLDPKLTTTVIPGEKISEKDLTPQQFDQFASRYGIQYVVLEHTGRKQPCDALYETPTPSMNLERQISLTSSLQRWNGGRLNVYRIKNTPTVLPDTLRLPVPKIGGEVQVKF